MNNVRILAKRYAQAFLETFTDEYDRTQIDQLDAWGAHLSERRQAFFFLALSTIPASHKIEQLIASARLYCNIPSLRRLIVLLVDQGRAQYILEVIKEIVAEYRLQNHIMPVVVTTSHAITGDLQEQLKKFIADKTGNEPLMKVQQDDGLIAGIRLQSATVLWEHSVRKQLRTLYALLS